MSIKIKTLKRFLLVFLCCLFASINYLTYVQADNSNDTSASDTSNQTTASGLTDAISNDFQTFLDSKSGQPITLPDLSAFSAQEASNTIGNQNVYATFDDLPQVDTSNLKILSQKYPDLSATERRAQIIKDDNKFILSLLYLFISNSPVPILQKSDLTNLKDQISNNLVGLSDTDNSASLAYFTNLGNRLDLIISQSRDLQVPETMLDVYTKALRILAGFLSLREDGKNFNDPLSQLIILKKVSNLANLTKDFYSNDVVSFMKSTLLKQPS